LLESCMKARSDMAGLKANPERPKRAAGPGDTALFLARIDRLIRLGDRLLRCLKEARDGLR
jgi:hypothetical protein